MTLSSAISAHAAETNNSGETRKLFDFLWSGMNDNHLRLRTGTFRFHGRQSDFTPAKGRVDGEVSGFCTFDFPKGLLRFDRTAPTKTSRANAVAATGTVAGKWIRTPTETIERRDGARIASVYPADRGPPGFVAPFDVRGLGLAYRQSLKDGTSFEKLHAQYAETSPTEISKEGSTYRIQWVFDRGTYERTLWTDAEKGFAPVRLELRRPKRGSDGRSSGWADPYYESEVTWRAASGVWVPETFRARETWQPPAEHEYDLAFTWEVVNGPVDPVQFTVRGLELNEGEVVADVRSGKPVVVQTITREEAELSRRGRGANFARIVGVSLTALVILGSAAWIIIARRRRRAGKLSSMKRSPRER